MGAPGMDSLQHWRTRHLQFRVRAGEWDQILSMPEPGIELPHAQALRHYARGRALAATGDSDTAEKELEQLATIVSGPDVQSLTMEFHRSAEILPVAREVLAGRIAQSRGNFDAEAFRQDLEKFPANGWLLHGLARAEEALGSRDTARELERQFQEVWKEADIRMAQR